MATHRKANIQRRSKAEIQNALKQLREHYALGSKILKSGLPRAGRAGYGEGIARTIGGELRLTPLRLYGARQFACEYDRQQFNQLLTLRLLDGMPLTRTHIDALLKVCDRRERQRLLKQVIKEGWSGNRLMRFVRYSDLGDSKSGRYQNAGRPPRRPQSVFEGLRQIEAMSIRWTRWYENLPTTKRDTDESSPVSLTNFPSHVRTKLASAIAAIEDLHEAVRGAVRVRCDDLQFPNSSEPVLTGFVLKGRRQLLEMGSNIDHALWR